MNGIQQVVPNKKGGWDVISGFQRFLIDNFPTQGEAAYVADQRAKVLKSERIIRNADGRIRQRDHYGRRAV